MPEHHRVEIRSAPDCPLVDQVRSTLDRALARTHARAEIEDLVGDYASPTLIIDGRDVTGRPLDEHNCCRLDLPSEDDVVAALQR
jgi:hypothetical protein